MVDRTVSLPRSNLWHPSTPYGKVPLDHSYVKGREGDEVIVESFDGRLWREPNPR